MHVGTIAELWRYPVKGMHGEQLQTVELDTHGIAGDRRYAIQSEGAPRGKPMLSGAERAAMLLFRAGGEGSGTIITAPGGERLQIDDTGLLEMIRHHLPGGHALTLIESEAPLTDVRPVALLGLATVEQLSREVGKPVDARRFRANILLRINDEAGFSEDSLVGSTVRLGKTAELRITERDPRCRVVILDPETATPDPQIMKHLDRSHQGRLGIYGVVQNIGTLRVGDTVEVL